MKKKLLISAVFLFAAVGFWTILNTKEEITDLPPQNVGPNIETGKDSDQLRDSKTSPSNGSSDSKLSKLKTDQIPEPNLTGAEFKNAVSTILNRVPKEIRPRIQIGIHEYTENKVWAHLKLDGARIEMSEVLLKQKGGSKEYSVASGPSVPLPKNIPAYQAMSDNILKSLVSSTLNLPLNSIEITKKPEPLWQYKPGLTPIAAVEIKVKTETSTHSGEILRFSTPQGKLLKRYQSVRH